MALMLVGGFCMPHDPLITGSPEVADPKQAANVMAAYSDIRRRVEGWSADTVIVIGDDHYVLFGPGCVPQMLIAIGELEGPLEPWLRIERGVVPNHPALAEHIMKTGFDRGFDWAVAKTMTLDHSTMVPIHLTLRGNPKVRVIPVYLCSGVTPVIRAERAFAVGKLIREAGRVVAGKRARRRLRDRGNQSLGRLEGDGAGQRGVRPSRSLHGRAWRHRVAARDGRRVHPRERRKRRPRDSELDLRARGDDAAGRPRDGKDARLRADPPWVTGLGLVELQSGGVS